MIVSFLLSWVKRRALCWEVDGTEGNKETAKQNHEDDTLSIYGSEDSEIVTDEEEEKEEERKKIIFRRIWPNFGKKKPRKAMFKSTAFNVYSCSHKVIYPGQMETFSLGFKMKMPKGYCAKIYGRLGMTVKHGIHFTVGVSTIDPDCIEGPSVFVSKTHTDATHMKSKSMTRLLK